MNRIHRIGNGNSVVTTYEDKIHNVYDTVKRCSTEVNRCTRRGVLGSCYFGAEEPYAHAARSTEKSPLIAGSSSGGQRHPDRPLGTEAQIFLRAQWGS